MKKSRLLRRFLCIITALCLLLLLAFIGLELYGNHVAALWEAQGFPDLREPTHGWFWVRILFTLGIGFVSLGGVFLIDEKSN